MCVVLKMLDGNTGRGQFYAQTPKSTNENAPPEGNKGILFNGVVVDEWEKARQIPDILEERVFRGQSKVALGLETSIERIAARQDYPLGQLAERERHMVREFQRRAHHHVTAPPSPKDRLERLAMIQHYGGPTRLLDFTHSFYTAAFFSVRRFGRRRQSGP